MIAEKTVEIKFHNKQKEIFLQDQDKHKVIVKGRRFGLTKGAANYFILKMLEGASPLLWVDTIHSNIDRYVERYFIPVLRQLPASLWQWRQQKKELRVLESVCDFRSADIPENIEGFGYKIIFLNEAGIILKDEYLWHNAIEPMILDYCGKVIIGGTPKGCNLFYTLYLRAQERDDWKAYHYTTYDNPYLQKEEIDRIVSEMPERVVRQEIYAKFLEDNAGVFRNVRKCIKGQLEEPQKDKTYVIGWDPAKYQDFSVITVMDREERRVVWFERFNNVDYAIQLARLEAIAKKYNDAYVVMDCTGVGDPLLEQAKRRGLQVEGYQFTNTTKQNLIDNLIVAIEQEEISFPEIKPLINELELFEYEMTKAGNIKYSAPEGYHDDCVISLALAVYGLKRYYGKVLIW